MITISLWMPLAIIPKIATSMRMYLGLILHPWLSCRLRQTSLLRLSHVRLLFTLVTEARRLLQSDDARHFQQPSAVLQNPVG